MTRAQREQLTRELLRVREPIRRALAHSGPTHSLSDVIAKVLAEQAQLWTNGSSVIVTEVIEYPKLKRLHLWLAGGVEAELLPLLETAIEWGRAVGCQEVQLTGRMGWIRHTKFRRLCGFKPVAVVMRRRITDE
jgi:hypothetical protein